MHVNRKGAVEAGYDRMSGAYLASKDENDKATGEALDDLIRRLPEGAAVLDLGCGAGFPVAQRLAQRFVVTGVDISAEQLKLAREYVPIATFIKADMSELELPQGSFDAVVALYSIIHVPREEHGSLLRKIRRWLKPGGIFLATWPLTEWEGEEENWEGWGATMWWSHFDKQTYIDMLRHSGFEIEWAEEKTSGSETWIWALAARQSRSGDVAKSNATQDT